jgi:protein SCO1/2
VLLTFYYSKCPMLCSVQLGDLVDVLNKSRWVVGDKFRIVSVSLDPTETHQTAFETRESYLDRYSAPEVPDSRRFTRRGEGVDSRTAIAESWTFLVGDQRSIDALAEAVGFNYNYIPRKREYAHPTAIIVLSANGMVVSYLHGLSFEAEDLNSRVVSAALEQPTASTAQFVFSCFHFTEPTGLTAIAFKAMRYAGLLFVVLLGGALVLLHRRRRGQTGNSK